MTEIAENAKALRATEPEQAGRAWTCVDVALLRIRQAACCCGLVGLQG